MQARKRTLSFVKRGSLRTDLSLAPLLKDKELSKLLTPITGSDIASRAPAAEFELLNRLTLTPAHKERLVSHPSFKPLNRYRDILPFKDTIVKLDANELSPSNYINANRIENPLRAADSVSFIATQGPLEETCGHFWRMAEQENSSFVVAIVEQASLGARCHDYWPTENPVKQCGNHTITETEAYRSEFIDIKAVTVQNQISNNLQTLSHAHLHSWPDRSALPRENYADFVGFLKVLHYHAQEHPDAPIIVHCSAGIGRTGTLIASYYLYEQWVNSRQQGKEFTFSVFGLVRLLREQRYRAVQTLEQYAFLYEIVRHFE